MVGVTILFLWPVHPFVGLIQFIQPRNLADGTKHKTYEKDAKSNQKRYEPPKKPKTKYDPVLLHLSAPTMFM